MPLKPLNNLIKNNIFIFNVILLFSIEFRIKHCIEKTRIYNQDNLIKSFKNFVL
jgi:hypothetical protein